MNKLSATLPFNIMEINLRKAYKIQCLTIKRVYISFYIHAALTSKGILGSKHLIICRTIAEYSRLSEASTSIKSL